MIEHAVAFPAAESLIGVMTEPIRESTGTPCVVFLNAGMLHRIGPNRLHVRLARHLAGRGLASLRFDLSGVGDSPPRRDGVPVRAAAVRDTQEAMDLMTISRGAGTFVLAGVCSGADLAYRVALAAPRVVGLILIDGLPYRTRRAALHFAWTRLVRYGAWRRVLSPRRALAGLRTAAAPDPAVKGSLGRRDVAAMAEADAGLRTLTERGVRLLAIYTEGREYAYRRQFEHSFPSVRRDRVRVEYFEGSDHTFTLRANQERLVNVIDEWMNEWR